MNSTDNIWVIDDDRSIRWVLEKALKSSGMTVTTFEDGNKIINTLEKEQPDVIVSDIRMPGIDGIKLLENVSEQYPDIPVIIMTAHSDLDSALQAYQGGAFEYLPKPFDIDEAIEPRQLYYYQLEDVEFDNTRDRHDIFSGQAQQLEWTHVLLSATSLVLSLALLITGIKENRAS